MPRIRTIKPEAWQDRALGECSREARLMWVALLTFADDEGRFFANPGTIFGHAYPYDLSALAEIERWMVELHDAGLIRLYQVDGEPFGVFPRWGDHQKVSHPSPSRLPSPPEPLTNNSGEVPEDSGTPVVTGDSEDSGAAPEDSGAARASTTDHRSRIKDQGSRGGVAHAGATDVFAALESAGYGRLEVERDAPAIRQALSEHAVPADVDWWRFGQDVLRKREGGHLRSDRPIGAVRFMLRGVTGLPRLGQRDEPAGRRSAGERRSEISRHYAEQALSGLTGGGES